MYEWKQYQVLAMGDQRYLRIKNSILLKNGRVHYIYNNWKNLVIGKGTTSLKEEK